MKNKILLIIPTLLMLCYSFQALAAPPPVIAQSVAVCNPDAPQQCTTPNADGTTNTLGVGSTTFTPSQISVGTTATPIVSTRPGRSSVTVENLSTTALYLGPSSGVLTTNGVLLPGVVGSSITLPYTGPIYGITTSGTTNVAEYELYGSGNNSLFTLNSSQLGGINVLY